MTPPDWERWKAARLAALVAPDGWLNLTDRLPLTAGTLSVGSGACDLRISCGPELLGLLTVEGDSARFTAPGGAPVPFVTKAGYPQLAVGQVLLELHGVDGEQALRVRDMAARPQIALQYFPFDPSWVKTARWEALPAALETRIGQKGAADTAVQVTHRATFRHDGQDQTLLATHWKGAAPMFVIRDATSGGQTYAASRFLLGEDVAGDAITLDFNKAHNPPCAFTDLAICPLPPRDNILPFAIAAGERAP